MAGISGPCIMVILGARTFAFADPPQYLKFYDPDANLGRGDIMITGDKTQAYVFPSIQEALECWKTVSAVLPTRPDGKPNFMAKSAATKIDEYVDAVKARDGLKRAIDLEGETPDRVAIYEKAKIQVIEKMRAMSGGDIGKARRILAGHAGVGQ